jgi:ABC-2 type transport system ATP-binding protein
MAPLMEVRQLVKTYGSTRAVNGITFTIEAGRCTALLGPNGAGKTTTLNMLSGLLKPTSGEIRFDGATKGEDLRAYIGYLPQYTAYYNWMTGREFLIYVGQLTGMDKRSAVQRAEELLRLVGIEDAKHRRIGGYSGGMKQRLGLAQAMMHRPRLLVLDEPVSALDPIGRREVLELMKRIRQETTILFSTHVLPDAEEVCDDVLIIRQGEIVIAGSLDEIRKSNQRPVIELELEDGEALADWLPALRELAGSAAVEQNGPVVRFTVEDADELPRIRQQLMIRLAELKAPLSRLEIARTSLEDLFMEAVRR